VLASPVVCVQCVGFGFVGFFCGFGVLVFGFLGVVWGGCVVWWFLFGLGVGLFWVFFLFRWVFGGWVLVVLVFFWCGFFLGVPLLD